MTAPRHKTLTTLDQQARSSHTSFLRAIVEEKGMVTAPVTKYNYEQWALPTFCPLRGIFDLA